jgi:hypothetical protein
MTLDENGVMNFRQIYPITCLLYAVQAESISIACICIRLYEFSAALAMDPTRHTLTPIGHASLTSSFRCPRNDGRHGAVSCISNRSPKNFQLISALSDLRRQLKVEQATTGDRPELN